MKMKISIPTELNEIKLCDYQRFVKILNENEESDFLHHKMIEIFCKIDLNLISQMRQKDVEEASRTINELFNKIPPLVTKFNLNGVEYGFIPNLNDISSGEYMDLDTYINDWDEMNRAMAIIYRPIKQKLGDKYLIEDYVSSQKYAEIMKDAPLNVALSAVVFFWILGKELLKSTMHYLTENQQANFQSNHNSEEIGDGILQSMHSLKAILDDSMKLPDYRLINV